MVLKVDKDLMVLSCLVSLPIAMAQVIDRVFPIIDLLDSQKRLVYLVTVLSLIIYCMKQGTS